MPAGAYPPGRRRGLRVLGDSPAPKTLTLALSQRERGLQTLEWWSYRVSPVSNRYYAVEAFPSLSPWERVGVRVLDASPSPRTLILSLGDDRRGCLQESIAPSITSRRS